MVLEVVDFDYVVIDFEVEVFLFENIWIKCCKLCYNIWLCDDKMYLYFKLMMWEEYFWFVFMCCIIDDGVEYFGFFLLVGFVCKVIKLVQKFFQVWVCCIEIDGKLLRFCFYYDMKWCLGLCVDGLMIYEEYMWGCEQVQFFFVGCNDMFVIQLC